MKRWAPYLVEIRLEMDAGFDTIPCIQHMVSLRSLQISQLVGDHILEQFMEKLPRLALLEALEVFNMDISPRVADQLIQKWLPICQTSLQTLVFDTTTGLEGRIPQISLTQITEFGWGSNDVSKNYEFNSRAVIASAWIQQLPRLRKLIYFDPDMQIRKTDKTLSAKDRYWISCHVKQVFRGAIKACPSLEWVSCYSVFQEDPLQVTIEALVKVEIPAQIARLRMLTYLLIAHKGHLPTELIRVLAGMLY